MEPILYKNITVLSLSFWQVMRRHVFIVVNEGLLFWCCKHFTWHFSEFSFILQCFCYTLVSWNNAFCTRSTVMCMSITFFCRYCWVFCMMTRGCKTAGCRSTLLKFVCFVTQFFVNQEDWTGNCLQEVIKEKVRALWKNPQCLEHIGHWQVLSVKTKQN